MIKKTKISSRISNRDVISIDGYRSTKSLGSIWIVGCNDLILGPGIPIKTEDVCTTIIGI